MTLKEKAKSFVDHCQAVVTSEGNLYSEAAVYSAYLSGAQEALATQWRSAADELPEEHDEVVVIFTHPYRPFITENTIAYWDGEDWYTVDGEHIRPTHWMSIPELPKTDNHV